MATQLSQPPHGSPAWFYQCVERASAGNVFTEVVSLTPQLAKELLKQNFDNRSIRATKVEHYAADILAGRWSFNGEPIIISSDGKLNDGQHRASAVVEADTAVPALLVFGVDRETRTTVDQGAARGAGDYLLMDGVAYAKNAATAAKFIIAFERSAGRNIGARKDITNAEIIDRVRVDEGVRLAAAYAHRNLKSYRSLVSHTVVAACWYILTHIDPVAGTRFMDQVTLGENIHRGDPAFAVRSAFLSEKRERGAAMEIIFHGWNRFRAELPLTLIRANGAFPVLA